jgi:hypothetical protein
MSVDVLADATWWKVWECEQHMERVHGAAEVERGQLGKDTETADVKCPSSITRKDTLMIRDQNSIPPAEDSRQWPEREKPMLSDRSSLIKPPESLRFCYSHN